MNVISVHIFYPPRAPSASAHIDVPGIGEIHIDNAISNELREAIAKEAIFVLRQKMGLPQEIKKPTLRPQYWKNDIKMEEPNEKETM